MDQFNKAPDTSTTGNTAYPSTYNYSACANRLPCGYCMILSMPCPMQGNAVMDPTWKLPDITC